MGGFIEQLSPEVAYFKIGMRAFFGGGFALLEEIKRAKAKVFLDLKLLDIPNTVADALKSLETQNDGIVLATIHMMGEGMKEALKRAQLERLKVLAVTVLTSEKAVGNLSKKVLGLAVKARSIGCAGVICSPLEARQVRAGVSDDFLIVCPGVRPDWSEVAGDDQQRVTTPAQAIDNGADYIVVGRPIYQAKNPLKAARRINQEMDLALQQRSEGTQQQRSEGTQQQRSEGTQQQRSEGTQQQRSEGTQQQRSEGTQQQRSEGTQQQRSEGTQQQRSEGTQQQRSEGTQQQRSEGTQQQRSEGTHLAP